MRIDNIIIDNFRCFEHINIAFNPNMNVLVGNNGAGKTTLLEAVSVGIGSLFLGIESVSAPNINKTDVRVVANKIGSTVDMQPQYPVTISCSGVIDERSLSWKRSLNTENGRTTFGDALNIKDLSSNWQNMIRKGDPSIALPLISYYGTGRLWAQKHDSSLKAADNRLQGYTDCLSAKSNEKLMLKWFEKMTYAQLQDGVPIPELQSVYNAMKVAFTESGVNAEEVRIWFDVKSHCLKIAYINENGDYEEHPFYELSDGYRNTLSLIADIAYRMSVLNPQFLGDAAKKTTGIVLIDEVDLHLHPKWQRNILKTLHKVFPLIQFIVTTHSPSVISSAGTDELLILDGKECRVFDYNVYGKDANSVLKEIMGASDRPDDVTELFSSFDEAIDKENYSEAEKKLEALRKILGDNDNGVVSATVSLDFRKNWEE